MNYTTQFQSIYSEFMRSDLFKSMEQTVENNDWHLESNVGVHTVWSFDLIWKTLRGICQNHNFWVR